MLPRSRKIAVCETRPGSRLSSVLGSRKPWQLFLDQSREETCSNRQCSVVEIVMRVVDGAAADATGIANIDKGARAGFTARLRRAPWSRAAIRRHGESLSRAPSGMPIAHCPDNEHVWDRDNQLRDRKCAQN
jgi:hypothetical protein